jgi:hypothetical protein
VCVRVLQAWIDMVCRNGNKLQKQKVNFLLKNEATLKKKDKKHTTASRQP